MDINQNSIRFVNTTTNKAKKNFQAHEDILKIESSNNLSARVVAKKGLDQPHGRRRGLSEDKVELSQDKD